MEIRQMASFVVRFQLAAEQIAAEKKEWRIKVTHVQEEQETLFDSIEAAMAHMKGIVEDSWLERR